MRNQEEEKQLRIVYRKLLKVFKTISDKDELKKIREAVTKLQDFSDKDPSTKQELWAALTIAGIVAEEIGLGSTSVIASLVSATLRYEIPDEKYLRSYYGEKITEISTGLHKIDEIPSEKTQHHAENLRKLVLTIGKDVRVILIKIAERLYILRNLSQYKEEQQIRYISEAKYIYSPLAHRLGLYTIMSEMEDICLSYTEPEEYRSIDRKLRATKGKREKFIKEFISPLSELLEKHRLKADIKGRPKAISSIWRKMKKQNVEFEEVYDKFAIRIILDSKPSKEKSDCWRAYSIVTDLYKPNPDRLRDWVSVPKSNGYESLHTTVIVPGGDWVEVQIRTRRMDEIAEKGLAAHWKYKGIRAESGIDDWLVRIREMLENQETDALNLIDDLRLSIDNQEIFVFTPKGDLKKFPQGATILDFAFDIHTDVGTSCTGAKVSGRNVPIRYQLRNGDKIEINRSRNQNANIDWLNYVVTSKAKSKIRLALKEQKLKEAENGREILKRRFKNWKVEFKDPLVRKLLQHYKYKDSLDFYYDVATQKIDLLEIKDILNREEKPDAPKSIPVEEGDMERIIHAAIRESNDYLIIDKKLSDVDYKLGKCCNPIFGDEIFGFVTVASGITIHRINCPNAHQLITRYGYRIVRAHWSESEKEQHFLASLRITGNDDIGIVSNISEVISKDLKVNMRSFKMDSSDGLFEGTVSVFVKDTNHLKVLEKKLMKVKGVISVRRMN